MGKSRFIHNTCIIDGIQFASEAESRRYLELKALKRTGEISEFELQPRYKLLEAFRKCPACGNNQAHVPGTSKKSVVNCQNCGTKTEVVQGMEYVADFKLIYPDGTERIEDVKGTKKFMDEIFKHKRKWFNFLYPGKYIHIVVMPPVKKPRAAHKAINEKRRK